MDEFDNKTIKAMRTVLEEVCRPIPADSREAKSFMASRSLECAKQGERTHNGLLAAGRRAVIDQFGTIDAARLR